jgi:hypothetical protein
MPTLGSFWQLRMLPILILVVPSYLPDHQSLTLNILPVLGHLASVFSRKIASPFEGGLDFDFDLIGNSGVVRAPLGARAYP